MSRNSSGYLDFCYRPVLPINGSTSWDYEQSKYTSKFTVWQDGDFGLCFEYITFLTATSALFGLTSAIFAGLKFSKLHRKRMPFILLLRMLLSLLVVINSLVEMVAGFWLTKERPYSVLLSQTVLMMSWTVHIGCIYVLSKSITHHGRGPLTLDTAWFMTFVGCVIHLRTVLRWHYHPDHYTYKFAVSDDIVVSAYFQLLIQITTYVYFGLQCLYALTLLFKVSQVTGDNVLFPSQRKTLEISGSLTWNDDAETSIRQQLVTANWSPAHTSHSTYGSIFSGSANSQYQWFSPRINLSKLEANEDKANFLSRLSFWWVEPLMKKGGLGLLQKPEDLPQLPCSLNTDQIRRRFRTSILKGQRRQSPHQRTYYSLSRTSSPSRMGIDSETDEDSGTWEDSLRASMSSPDVKTRCTPVDEPNQSQNTQEQGGEYRVSLFWALNRAFGARYYPLGLLKLLADMMNFAGPLLLHYLVSFMENRQVSNSLYRISCMYCTLLICVCTCTCTCTCMCIHVHVCTCVEVHVVHTKERERESHDIVYSS